MIKNISALLVALLLVGILPVAYGGVSVVVGESLTDVSEESLAEKENTEKQVVPDYVNRELLPLPKDEQELAKRFPILQAHVNSKNMGGDITGYGVLAKYDGAGPKEVYLKRVTEIPEIEPMGCQAER